MVFFDFPGDSLHRISHVALVEAVNGDGSITTIEGNTSSGQRGSQRDGDGVWRRTRRTGIVGYGYPAYGSGPGRNRGGDQVRRTQAAVHVPVDGDWGPETDRAVSLVRSAARGKLRDVKATQRAVGTRDDGEWGPIEQGRAGLDGPRAAGGVGHPHRRRLGAEDRGGLRRRPAPPPPRGVTAVDVEIKVNFTGSQIEQAKQVFGLEAGRGQEAGHLVRRDPDRARRPGGAASAGPRRHPAGPPAKKESGDVTVKLRGPDGCIDVAAWDAANLAGRRRSRATGRTGA